MNKITPLLLTVIMLASTSLAALDWTELEQNNMIEADGRVGPDAEVVSILSPRATTTDSITGEQLHTLKAGEDVNFEAFITNAGDVAIAEMGVTLTVYLSEGGARGMIAKDSAGNDMSWTNGDVICDDTFVCPWATLDSGANLNYGRYAMTYQGSPIVWTPITGEYVVVVETFAEGDNEPGNDYQETPVSVVDWTDVIVDLAWDSGKEVEGGAGDKAFTLTVSTGGSSSWSARSITLSLEVIGTVDSATDSSGSDIMGTTTIAEFGTYGMTETFRHQDDANNTTSHNRYVIDFLNDSTWTGQLTPDTSGESGDYSIEVSLVSYVVYGQLPECTETSTSNSSSEEIAIDMVHYCEVTKYQDGDVATSEDMIEGKVQTFHDIGVTGLVINQGYVVDDNNAPLSGPTMPGVTTGPLNPTWSSVQASVRHLGSDTMVTYDWSVSFDIENTVTGVTYTESADSCLFGLGEAYTHLELGMDPMGGAALEMGEACIMFEFVPGIYNVTATVSMVGGNNTDMSNRNNDASIYEIASLNNRPDVTLTLETVGDLIIGPEGMITIVANADDADDDGGLTLEYVWSHPGMPEGPNGSIVPSPCNGIGPMASTCNLIALDDSWAGVNTYSVRVTDLHGSYAVDFMNIHIWNQVTAFATSASGIGMQYDLTFDGNEFDIAKLDDTTTEYTEDLTAFGYAGDYTSVAVLDYAPSTTYMAEDVLAQSITLTYDGANLAPTSAFWISNGNWAKLDAIFTMSGSDGSIAIDLGDNGQVLPQGEIVLMGGVLQIIEPPLANPTGLVVSAEKGGVINAGWSYAGTTVPGFDWLELKICDDAGTCDTTNENTTLVAHSLSGQTDTMHGVTYTYTLTLCNSGGCNPTIATASAVADNAVNGDAVAESMSVANKDDSTWTVSWTVGGTDSTDVAGWKVCYTDFSWATSGAMPATCDDAGAATSADIMHPGGSGTKTYYFTAVPYDTKGNMDNAEPGTDILLIHANVIDDPCVEDPSGDECKEITDKDKDDTSGAIPTEAWVAIISLVVIALVVGAFILTRGEKDGEGKDWDY